MPRTSVTKSGRPPCDDAILEWLAESTPATALQIARALSMPKPTAYAALIRLEQDGKVCIQSGVARGRQVAHLWAVSADDTSETIVARALRSQPPIALAWARPTEMAMEGETV